MESGEVCVEFRKTHGEGNMHPGNGEPVLCQQPFHVHESAFETSAAGQFAVAITHSILIPEWICQCPHRFAKGILEPRPASRHLLECVFWAHLRQHGVRHRMCADGDSSSPQFFELGEIQHQESATERLVFRIFRVPTVRYAKSGSELMQCGLPRLPCEG